MEKVLQEIARLRIAVDFRPARRGWVVAATYTLRYRGEGKTLEEALNAFAATLVGEKP